MFRPDHLDINADLFGDTTLYMISLCWPKRQIYKPNEPFKTEILERGPNKNFVVSLYAVDQACHEDILKWFDEIRITRSKEGFPILPDSFKLDSRGFTIRERL